MNICLYKKGRWCSKKKNKKGRKVFVIFFFDKYRKEYSDILSTAAVLDPKLKFAILEYCYDTLDPLTSKSKVDHIRKKIKKLYGVYKKDPKSITASPSETTLVNNIPDGYGVVDAA
uniref:hAT-like transposase RNase-H fold domain-containing protein n=1 Tax=Brassica oleracea var. oleracea TaxID=109376 RepID=A0A0D3B823_BRAOL